MMDRQADQIRSSTSFKSESNRMSEMKKERTMELTLPMLLSRLCKDAKFDMCSFRANLLLLLFANSFFERPKVSGFFLSTMQP